jgi:GT2 family glycosyltransferase
MTIPLMVVPTLSRRDLLYEMFGSIDYPVEHLLVIDNGSQGFGDLGVPNVSTVSVADLRSNLGVAASWNLGIKVGYRHDWTMHVSDDVRFPPGALERFVELSAPDRIVLSATWPYWCAFTIGAEVVADVGLFDENYYPAYYEDTDYLERLDAAKITPTAGPEVEHKNSSTLATPDRDYARKNRYSFEANLRYFESKVPYERGGGPRFDPFRWRAQTWD